MCPWAVLQNILSGGSFYVTIFIFSNKQTMMTGLWREIANQSSTLRKQSLLSCSYQTHFFLLRNPASFKINLENRWNSTILDMFVLIYYWWYFRGVFCIRFRRPFAPPPIRNQCHPLRRSFIYPSVQVMDNPGMSPGTVSELPFLKGFLFYFYWNAILFWHHDYYVQFSVGLQDSVKIELLFRWLKKCQNNDS